ncbi:phosphatidylinositol-4- kinase [Basidiobolus ranarum]|uniref:1-phosphatidylinositol 4-kinase n=1 Tax=Basidiobolus ranarum TaxID=34480 RepID=A0ABR2W9A1_9FUNG
MDWLEFNLHELILDEIAGVLTSEGCPSSEDVEKFLSQCPAEINPATLEAEDRQPTLMTIRNQKAIKTLAKFCADSSNYDISGLVSLLIRYMENLVFYEYEESHSWKVRSPQDEFAYDLVFWLLKTGLVHEEYQDLLSDSIIRSFSSYGKMLNLDKSDRICTVILPLLNGFLRAIEESSFVWNSSSFGKAMDLAKTLLVDDTLDAIRNAVSQVNETVELTYSKVFLQKYWESEPLSSNMLIYRFLACLRNILIRQLEFTEKQDTLDFSEFKYLWHSLSSTNVISNLPETEAAKKDLRAAYVMSLKYFSDIKQYMDELEYPSKDFVLELYCTNILVSSLEVATLSSLHMNEIDEGILSKTEEYLNRGFRKESLSNNIDVTVSCLDACSVLAFQYPELTLQVIHMITKFLSSSSPLLRKNRNQFKEDTVLDYAIKKLGKCLETLDGEETTLSTIYSLLNTLYSIDNESSRKGSMCEQDKNICANVITAISGITSLSNNEKIMESSVSLLLRRLRNPSEGPLILEKLVDIALVAPMKTFNDLISVFGQLSKQLETSENKELVQAAIKSQLLLAQRLTGDQPRYELYLGSLLNVFIDKGLAIQEYVSKQKKGNSTNNSNVVGQLGSLLPVIAALLAHDDFNPHINSKQELVPLFRNTWLYCVLFDFMSDLVWGHEWSDAIILIGVKTPILALESATNYLDADLQNNTVLVRNLLDQDFTKLKSSLSLHLKNSDIRGLTFPQVAFLLAVYHIESIRSRMGDCAYILNYFANQGVASSNLLKYIEVIARQAINIYIVEAKANVGANIIEKNLVEQVRQLLVLSCHRLRKVHIFATGFIDKLVESFPPLFCDKQLVQVLLELVQLVWRSCESEYHDEYSPVYNFTSEKVNITLDLPDAYGYRQDLLTQLCRLAKQWLSIAHQCSPLEIEGLLKDYLADFDQDYNGESVHLGRSLALEIGRSLSSRPGYAAMSHIPTSIDSSSVFIGDFANQCYYRGEISGFNAHAPSESNSIITQASRSLDSSRTSIKDELDRIMDLAKERMPISPKELHTTLWRGANILITSDQIDHDLVEAICWAPVAVFTSQSLKMGTSIWTYLMVQRPDLEMKLMVEIGNCWASVIRSRKGIFSQQLELKNPFLTKMQYTPSDKDFRARSINQSTKIIKPHVIWVEFLTSRFEAIKYRNQALLSLFVRLLFYTFDSRDKLSSHPMSRGCRFQLLLLGLNVLKHHDFDALSEYKFRLSLFQTSLSWFEHSPRWSISGNKSLSSAEFKSLVAFYRTLEEDVDILETDIPSHKRTSPVLLSTLHIKAKDALAKSLKAKTSGQILGKTRDEAIAQFATLRRLLLLLLESEIGRFYTWNNPVPKQGDLVLQDLPNKVEKSMTEERWRSTIRTAWDISPSVAVHMLARFNLPVMEKELQSLVLENPGAAIRVPEAAQFLLNARLGPNHLSQLKYLLYWDPLPAISAAIYLKCSDQPHVLQYAVRALEHSPVDVVFFYVPQVVQALRHDELGYAEKYILSAAKISQLFAHQIIWNMNANMFKDDEASTPDSLKPVLDRVIARIVESLSGEDQAFYEKEFKFFNEVTGISGKLKPYIKKSKFEKKQKIDEEMKLIKVETGVYLPSNPDGVVIDIDYNSGKPLQSHAKAPFMATFRIRKERYNITDLTESEEETTIPRYNDVWLSAIFKVGDDCRQDVLALQLIAVFKSIFTSVGLDLYLFPYRVVATAPGCGVIDVIPNSISRDMLGREKVNSLYDYFLTKYGGLDSVEFQKARNNFVQSVAAYSVVSYLLQFKDRHNGNIMLDDEGHIVHIDFGFILDISPGGINFESAPFKLTTEMIQVMGGNAEVQQFKWFCDLCVKAYLASRPYAEQIIQLVALMMESGLPCFKGETTLKKLRNRFQLDKTESVAAEFMVERIRESFENRRTVWYDSFQKATNGIPH